ncbi:hypothetical protein G3R49_05475 [Shewanella sp. WXL01]|uniref:Uncharacterized protein n=1 Tax=Shewanella maritima TaxID=2520507 RepID=A0A411PEV5_9GAMM|nr:MULTISPECIES: hypothetical protein [Shewanella]NKF50021.1 hypothetical protein [Shewanella sp. WXL01]QBF81920.1 hypothetical protein EXU30_03815 [Shewanella maritima]
MNQSMAKLCDKQFTIKSMRQGRLVSLGSKVSQNGVELTESINLGVADYSSDVIYSSNYILSSHRQKSSLTSFESMYELLTRKYGQSASYQNIVEASSRYWQHQLQVKLSHLEQRLASDLAQCKSESCTQGANYQADKKMQQLEKQYQDKIMTEPMLCYDKLPLNDDKDYCFKLRKGEMTEGERGIYVSLSGRRGTNSDRCVVWFNGSDIIEACTQTSANRFIVRAESFAVRHWLKQYQLQQHASQPKLDIEL